MKAYKNDILGPDLEQCDIITYDLNDAVIQFCLPKSSEDYTCRLAQQDSLDNWHSLIDSKILVKNWWDYDKRDQDGEWNVGAVSLDMQLINLDKDDLETWLATKPYSILKQNELGRLAIEFFIKSAVELSKINNPSVSTEEAAYEYRIFTQQEDLLISKHDLLPWYTNKRNQREVSDRWVSQTFIPISDRAFLILQFDFTPQTSNNRPFFFSMEEGQEFGDLLRNEYLSYVKITYSPEIQEKIKQYAQNT